MGEKPPLTKKLPATTTVEYQYSFINIMFSLFRLKAVLLINLFFPGW